jgi:hypothetical protein
MNTPNQIEVIPSPEDSQSGSSRRSFLKGAALTGATTLAAASVSKASTQFDDSGSKSRIL